MRFLDFIEQHDGIRTAPDRFGQHAAFAVADISRRRALQSRHGMRFLKFRHIDGYQVALAAVKLVRERERRFGFADAARPDQHENTDRFLGIVETRPRRRNSLADEFERMGLPDHALAQDRSVEIRLWKSRPSSSCRPGSRSSGDHFANDLRIDSDANHRRLALQSRQFGFGLRQLRAQFGGIHRLGGLFDCRSRRR